MILAVTRLDPQSQIDCGYNAVTTLTPMAKQVIKTACGETPDCSDFDGWWNGRRHAEVAAARSSAEHDGIIAGDPGYDAGINDAGINGADWSLWKQLIPSRSIRPPPSRSRRRRKAPR